jgi:hypothetical protein
MSRAPASFRQSDLDRALRAAKKAGLTGYEIIIDGPRITLRVNHMDRAAPSAVGSSWDEAMAELGDEQDTSPLRQGVGR